MGRTGQAPQGQHRWRFDRGKGQVDRDRQKDRRLPCHGDRRLDQEGYRQHAAWRREVAGRCVRMARHSRSGDTMKRVAFSPGNLYILTAMVGGLLTVCPALFLAQAPEPPGTFSIIGFDPETGEIGAAVQSRIFSVGSRNIWADANAGVAVTQATGDTSYGPQALTLLKSGVAPAAIVKRILDDDPDPFPIEWSKQGRQFAVMNLKGEYAAHTGPKSTEWAGHRGGKYCTAQGNILAGPDVVKNMIERFEATEGHLSQRLVAALEGGQAAGGDKRGQQSAALVIVKKNCGVWLHNDTVLRLQVDDSETPIAELNRLVEKRNGRRGRAVSPECRGNGN